MTQIKLDSRVGRSLGITGGDAADAYHRLGSTRVAIVELTAVERTEPADPDEKDPSVKLRVTALELPRGDDETEAWKLMERVYEARTGMLPTHGDEQDDDEGDR